MCPNNQFSTQQITGRTGEGQDSRVRRTSKLPTATHPLHSAQTGGWEGANTPLDFSLKRNSLPFGPLLQGQNITFLGCKTYSKKQRWWQQWRSLRRYKRNSTEFRGWSGVNMEHDNEDERRGYKGWGMQNRVSGTRTHSVISGTWGR